MAFLKKICGPQTLFKKEIMTPARLNRKWKVMHVMYRLTLSKSNIERTPSTSNSSVLSVTVMFSFCFPSTSTAVYSCNLSNKPRVSPVTSHRKGAETSHCGVHLIWIFGMQECADLFCVASSCNIK